MSDYPKSRVSYRLDTDISAACPKSWSAGRFTKAFCGSAEEPNGERNSRYSMQVVPIHMIMRRMGVEKKIWNIFTIVKDDQATWVVGALGNNEVVTPNINRLAHEGALFINAFACSGECTSSRVGLLTGLCPMKVGFTDVPYLRDSNKGLLLSSLSWPSVLQQNGSVTGLIGKWYLDGNLDYYSTKFGID